MEEDLKGQILDKDMHVRSPNWEKQHRIPWNTGDRGIEDLSRRAAWAFSGREYCIIRLYYTETQKVTPLFQGFTLPSTYSAGLFQYFTLRKPLYENGFTFSLSKLIFKCSCMFLLCEGWYVCEHLCTHRIWVEIRHWGSSQER